MPSHLGVIMWVLWACAVVVTTHRAYLGRLTIPRLVTDVILLLIWGLMNWAGVFK